jgi:cytoskeletal protein CcmA (bactofilin family)
MAVVTVIGRGVKVRGTITGDSDLTIEGHVDGGVEVTGDVTIEAGALVGASVTGKLVVVRGAVKGDLSGADAVRLEEGARVVGDVRAPRIGIDKGALVRGHVQTGGDGTAAPRTRPATAAVSRPAPATKRDTTLVSPGARPAPSPARHAASPAPKVASGAGRPSPPSTLAGHAKTAPPPIVPSLKKGAKAALKKKAT